MKKAAVYIRVGNAAQLSADRQREELHAKFGDTHEIVAEYQDTGPGSSSLKKLLEDAAQGKFDVLLCTDITRLARRLSPEVVTALRDAGVRVMTANRGEVQDADLLTQTVITQSAKTYSEWMSDRIKQGIRASKNAASRKRPTPKK